jgi:hypothetical protein
VGESGNEPFELSFNRSLKVDFQGSRVTSDGSIGNRAGVGRASGHKAEISRLRSSGAVCNMWIVA